jgi:hypothetical protein
VRPSVSRRTQRSGVSGATGIVRQRPLTVIVRDIATDYSGDVDLTIP